MHLQTCGKNKYFACLLTFLLFACSKDQGSQTAEQTLEQTPTNDIVETTDSESIDVSEVSPSNEVETEQHSPVQADTSATKSESEEPQVSAPTIAAESVSDQQATSQSITQTNPKPTPQTQPNPQENEQLSSSATTPKPTPTKPVVKTVAVSKDGGDIGGQVKSANGPEAGVWVIAETKAFDTFFARIVVTDDQGNFVIPDLPDAEYQLWVRGYGLLDSDKKQSRPGNTINLTAKIADNSAAAAQVYPAAYWYAMMNLPEQDELEKIDGGLNNYLTWMKNMGCVGCHQLGQLSTRTFPYNTSGMSGEGKSHHDAWLKRISSGQAGQNMVGLVNRLNGLPLKYLADWTERIAAGELPSATPQRPSGLERNLVVTVRDWSNSKAYLHDLSGTDRRNPTVNAYGPLYGAPELSTDEFPVLNPNNNTASFIRAPVRDADTPTTGTTPPMGPSPYWGDEHINKYLSEMCHFL